VVDLVAPVAIPVAVEIPVVAVRSDVDRDAKLDTGPPDLYLRNLVLLV
jgi:hypothetical protein